MMDQLRAVLVYTLKEQLRHRALAGAALFGLVLVAGALLASALGAAERGRVMLDLGLAAIEAVTMLSLAFLSVRLVLADLESRALLLVLAHPVRRWHYLLGRFLGALSAAALGALLMAAVHVPLLALYGWWEPGRYAAALACVVGKGAILGSLALLLSLALTSEAAAMSFTAFFWVLGHFSSEMRFLAERSGSAALESALVAFSHAAPDFARLKYRDFWHGGEPSAAWFAWAALYVLGYAAACFSLAAQLFDQKEL